MSEPLIGAVEAGGTKFVLAVARMDGTIVARARMDTRTPAETFPEMSAFFAQHGPLAGIGIASFGPIDIDPTSPDYGTFTTTPKPGWSGARFHDALASLGAPIVVDTDVNGAALGEWLAGAGRGCETLAYTTVGTGIGTGVLHKGASRGGISHLEAGHVRPPRDAARDPFAGRCPFHGDCLEGLASGPAIIDRWGASLDEMAARQPDAVPLIASYLADFAVTLVLMHMPDRLIFGGGVMKAPGLIESLRQQAEVKLAGYVQHARLDPGLASYIVAPGLGDDAGITGALELARRASGQRGG
ncbi:ROK family protein [Erythrobacter sp. SDW2]|uniref:ROK family protein n=1 Tax=Erythrobacter sp. SDW2 TaxID=2907154 RepID=UPI001F200EEB|nr:ROK family protein [Erythrobacter sp. SDW2]UIP06456.1 ROK family protein [Erythrobacter sp. SDW2]